MQKNGSINMSLTIQQMKDNLKKFIEKLESITDLEIMGIRELALNKDFNDIIDSKKEFSEEFINEFILGTELLNKERVKANIDGINYYIRSRIVYGIRKNPNPKPTPLSAFDWVGHNETDVKHLKNSVQVNAF